MSNEKLTLPAVRTIVDVELESADGGSPKQCKLYELFGKERNQYLNKSRDRVKISKDGSKAVIKSFSGFQSELLSVCLYDESGDLMSVEDIEELPAQTQQILFEKAQEISGLNRLAGDDSKND